MNWLNRIIGAPASRKTLSQLGAIREEIAQLVDVGRKKAIARLGAIREAIREDGDDTGTLQSLLRQSMDLNTHDSIPPVYPIMLGGNGVMISRNDTLPLILAALHHKPERARLLLQRGARLDVTCGHGRTPLHWAVAGYAVRPSSTPMSFAAGTPGPPESPLSPSAESARMIRRRRWPRRKFSWSTGPIPKRRTRWGIRCFITPAQSAARPSICVRCCSGGRA